MIVEGLRAYCENCTKASLYIKSDILYANGKPSLITHALHCKNEELCERIRKELIKEFKEKWEINNESIHIGSNN